MQTIDTNLYSRQIGAYGMEAMSKLVELKVFIYGMRGLGVEIAKNVILAGPKSVTIYDPEITHLNDLGANFYLTHADVGHHRRDVASLTKLKELNPYVNVDVFEGTLADVDKLVNNHVVVITEVIRPQLAEELDQACRDNKRAFIYTAITGVSGFVFTDFGAEHIVRDENGEECKQYIVRNISQGSPGIVMIDDTIGTGKLAITDGDYVVFREVLGMNEINDTPPRPIKYVSPFAFSIEDTSKYSEYQGGGIVEQVKVPKVHTYKSLKDSFRSPYNNNKVPDPLDLAKFGRNELLHVGFTALHEFVATNGRLPVTNSEEDANLVVRIASELYNELKKDTNSFIQNSQDFDEKIIFDVARWSRCQISPIASFLGGVVAQEVVKMTGKFSPIDQWLWFDFLEITANLKEVNRSPLNSQYDDQVSIFGQDLQQRIFDLNIFLIGAGALGCEFIKEFALMGVSTKHGKVTLTDNDNIEISNLNRQFLFRKDDVGKSKSACAAKAAKIMNPHLNVESLQTRVGPENEHIFNDKFWESQNFIINAVDNVKARKYIDTMATWYNKVMIDSGTLGTKAHVQLIVPHVTCCYNDTQDPPEEGIPMCTLHNFPAMIEHCIEWGRDRFGAYFTDIIQDARNFTTDNQKFLSDLSKEGNSTLQLWKLQDIKKILDVSVSRSFDKCIEFGFQNFVENFDHKIRQLLHNFPPTYTNPDGSKFWSGSKRVPTPLTFDASDPTHVLYVASYAFMLSHALCIKQVNDLSYIAKVASGLTVPEFEAKKLKIKVNDADPDDNEEIGEEDSVQLPKFIEELKLHNIRKMNGAIFIPHEFEKDDDTNYHIDFIHACANLRARNYRIKETDRHRTKMIAGKIIPALATTTASICGLVALQLYTLMQTSDIAYMRNVFMNLAINLFVLTEPQEKVKHQDKENDPILLGPVKAIPPNWTVWDKIIVEGPMTVRELSDFFKNEYKIDVSIIGSGKATIYQAFLPSNQSRLNLKIEDVYNTNSEFKIREDQLYLPLEISADDEDGTCVVMPVVKYIFKK